MRRLTCLAGMACDSTEHARWLQNMALACVHHLKTFP